MGLFGPSKAELRAAVAEAIEARASIENPAVPISNQNLVSFLGLDGMSASGEPVTVDSALGVPAIWAAVSFLSGTMAGLPLHVYRKTKTGRERVSGALATMLHDAVNDGMSSFEWRKYSFEQVFTTGRALSFIERSGAGRPINLWPLDPSSAIIHRIGGRKVYDYQDGGRKVRYEASEVIDLPFMLKPDMLSHRSPIMANADVIGMAQAVTKYGGKFFQNGGVPPFMIEGPYQSPGGIQRAANDMAEAVQKAAKEKRLALALPAGHTVKQIGADPEKSQLVELQRFMVEQVARIYQLPPTFLQDLSHGTYSNTEQQDLHFVKHTIKRWVEQVEQELNLKLFGRGSNTQYVEFNVDGLLRGDFKTRMDGYSQAIQHGVLTPNEARQAENRPDHEAGERLYMQGAMMPIDKLGQDIQATNEATDES